MTRRGLVCGLGLLALLATGAPNGWAVGASGQHWRVASQGGPIHVWTPPGYDSRTAGTVVYLHGYFTSADDTWAWDELAEQFRASGRNALFVVPETPSSNEDPVPWARLDELLAVVGHVATVPDGPLVVIGHSGAFRTFLGWLDDPRLRCLVLLDALYKGEDKLRAWLLAAAVPRRMLVVGGETSARAARFTSGLHGVLYARLPDAAAELSPPERARPLLFFESQYEHMELVTGRKVIPLMLELTSLRGL